MESLWHAAMESSPVGMSVIGTDGRLLVANRALGEALGYSVDDLVGMHFSQLAHPEDEESDRVVINQLLAGLASSHRMTKRHRHADGSEVWGDLWVSLVRAADGTPQYFVTHLVDLTAQQLDLDELVKARGVIEQQRRTTQAVLDTVDIGVISIDRSGRYLQMNRRHADFMTLAYPEGHRLRAGQTGDVYGPETLVPLTSQETPTARAASGEEFDDVRMWVGADPATRRALSVSARSVLDEHGEFDGAVLAYSDVTELMRALQAQEEFVTSVSHELRTPLTAVLTHLELLLEGGVLDERVARPLRVVHRNALRLRNLVTDLLETAQQSQGVLELARTPTDLAELVLEAAEAARPLASSAGVQISTELPDRVVAFVDRPRMRQVVDNLLYNALKYTDPGGRVELSLEAADNGVRLRVTDTGMGIEPEDVARLFVPFFRSRTAQARKSAGMGLGLGIARAIVVAHEGQIEVSSTPGNGSTFLVTVPAVAPTR